MTGTIELYFRDPHRQDQAIVVDWIGLTPKFIGVYQVNFRLPAQHLRADALAVTLWLGVSTVKSQALSFRLSPPARGDI